MAAITKIKNVTAKTQEIVDLYIEQQNISSVDTIMAAIRKLMKETNKYDIQSLNYQDYCRFVKPSLETKSQSITQETFIKYLYAYEYLNNKTGFDLEYWNPEKIKQKFEKDKVVKKKKDYQVALTFEQLQRIQHYLSGISETDYDNMRLSLCYYMCFYTTISVIDDLRFADTKDYDNGVWTIKGISYEIPIRYEPLLLDMKNNKKSGLTSLHIYIRLLGNYVGIEKLYPTDIITARNQMQQQCFQCGKKDYAFAGRWKVVNDIIMCNDCAERVISSSDIKKNGFETFEVDLITKHDKEVMKIATNTFESLRKGLLTNIEYNKINEFLSFIGKLGERFVLEIEKKALLNTKYYEMVDPTPSLDHEKGYDIMSYEKNGTEVMIEVKTTTGNVSDPFIITNNELETYSEAKNNKKKYKIYRVGEILSTPPTLVIYDDLSEDMF